MGVLLSCAHSRSRSFKFIVQLRKLCILCLIINIKAHVTWIPSELGSSDVASRTFDDASLKHYMLQFVFDEQYNLRNNKQSIVSSYSSDVHHQTYVATVVGSAPSLLQKQGPPQHHFRARLARIFVAGTVRSQPTAPNVPRSFRALTAQIPAARPAAVSTHRRRSVRRTVISLLD